MIFQKLTPKLNLDDSSLDMGHTGSSQMDEVETVVGTSVHVEGDFSSEGNIVVKGIVTGSVTTSKQVSVERGAKVLADLRVGSAYIAGEVRGNVIAKEKVELASSARVVGDIETNLISIDLGAVWVGKISMPGIEKGDEKTKISSSRKV
jgi:cytoskeletal protein CcmA (bactofilin family)